MVGETGEFGGKCKNFFKKKVFQLSKSVKKAPRQKMGLRQSRLNRVWDWDPGATKKVILVRGVRGSGRSWLCDALSQSGEVSELSELTCPAWDCIDVNKFVRTHFDPELSRTENERNIAAKYKDLMSRSTSSVVVLIGDNLITTHRTAAKFFIELTGDSLPIAYRRGQAMMLHRVIRSADQIRAAIHNWPVSNVDSVFAHFGFDFGPHDEFSKFVVGYHRAKNESVAKGYTVLPISDIKNAILKMCH